MKPLVAPHIAAVKPYVPGKPVEELERELGIHGAVKLASNENPLGPSPKVLQAVARASAELHRYPDAHAHALRMRLAAQHGVSPGELAFGCGSNELIDLLVRTLADPSDHAVIGAPSFVCYGMSLRIANVPMTEVPLRDALYWDLPAMHAALRPNTKLVFLDNPNNPTSTHIAKAELADFLRALPRSVVPVVDEAYFEFADAPDFASALRMRHLHERLVVLRTFSKAHGLAALRVGYAVASQEIVSYLDRVRAPFNVGSLAQAAALASLDDAAYVARYVELNRSERGRVSAALQGMGLSVAPSQANFVCVGLGQPSFAVYDKLLRQGVIVRPFGAPLDRHLRISIGLPAENDRLLAALPHALAKT
ncbi:MAG TPA: histidinol-phosphate transaminase [Polyangiales bacterium]